MAKCIQSGEEDVIVPKFAGILDHHNLVGNRSEDFSCTRQQVHVIIAHSQNGLELLAVLRMTDDDMNPLPSTEKNFGWISEEITMVEDSSKFWGSYICLTILYALCHAGSLR